MKRLALVVPCHNECRRLDVDAFLGAVRKWPWLQLCFVDDGSTDGTGEVLARFAATSPSVITVALPKNCGKAAAVRAGMIRLCDELRPGPDLVGYWDADLATPLDELPDFVKKFEDNPCVRAVIGSRWPHLGAGIRRSAWRDLAGGLVKWVIRHLLDVGVWDTQCGAKVFDREFASELFYAPFRTKWLFDVELLFRAGRYNLETQVHEMPLRKWTDVPGSHLGVASVFAILRDLVVLRIAVKRQIDTLGSEKVVH